MKVLVIGSGGVGGYIASYLCKTNFNLTLLCRGKRFNFVKKNGLILNTLGKKLKRTNLNVTSELKKKTSFDIIINTVKLYDFDSVLEDILLKVENNFIMLPFQNGIYAEEKIKKKIGLNRSYGAVAQISSSINQINQEIDHLGSLATFFVGSYSNHQSKLLQIFCQKCQEASLNFVYKNDIKEKIWEKFIFLSAYSGFTTLNEKSIGQIFGDRNLKEKFIKAMEETYNLSKKFGIIFNFNPVEKWINKIDKMPYKMTSSMFIDFKNKKKLELDWLSGFILEASRKKGIGCETHEEIYRGIMTK